MGQSSLSQYSYTHNGTEFFMTVELYSGDVLEMSGHLTVTLGGKTPGSLLRHPRTQTSLSL